MSSMTGKAKRIDDAIQRICGLYEKGDLRASADPVEFWNDVAADIEQLREHLRDATQLGEVGTLPNERRVTQWRAIIR